MLARVLVAEAVLALVLDDEGLGWEIGAVPDVAALRLEIELGAGFRRVAEAHVPRAAVAHHLVWHPVLDDPQRGPALDALAADDRAGGRDRCKQQSAGGAAVLHSALHRRDCSLPPVA